MSANPLCPMLVRSSMPDGELTDEQRARRAFEAIAGEPMSDDEWAEAEANLTDFLEIARQWRDNSLHGRKGPVRAP